VTYTHLVQQVVAQEPAEEGGHMLQAGVPLQPCPLLMPSLSLLLLVLLV
jgi:hypothetical protein